MLGLRHAVEAQESGGTIIVPGSARPPALPCHKAELGRPQSPQEGTIVHRVGSGSWAMGRGWSWGQGWHRPENGALDSISCLEAAPAVWLRLSILPVGALMGSGWELSGDGEQGGMAPPPCGSAGRSAVATAWISCC